MDVGAVGGWSWHDDVGGGYDQEAMHAVGFKGKGESKGEGDCYTCISRGSAPIRKRARTRAMDSKENVIILRSKSSCTRVPERQRRRKAKRKRRRLQRERQRSVELGKRNLASRKRRTSMRLPEEQRPSTQPVGKEMANVIDQDGYELIKRPRRLGSICLRSLR